MEPHLRVVTLNLLNYLSASGPSRHRAVKSALAGLDADVVAFQEVTRTADFDQAADLLGPGYTILDVPGGDPTYGGECLATRRQVLRVDPLDVELPDSRAEDPGLGHWPSRSKVPSRSDRR